MKDCHIHLSTLFGPAEPPEVFMKKAADAGIDGGTIMSLPPVSFRVDPERSQYWKDRMDFILEYTSHTPGFHPFFWIDPTEKDAFEQIAAAADAGVKGFKCICNHFYPEECLKQFSAIAETGLTHKQRACSEDVFQYLSASPRSYGWHEDLWNMTLIKKQIQKDTGKIISTSTLERLLKDCGYSYKQPRKGVPVTAPSKEEKLARVQEIAKEILSMTKDSDVEVMFVDESHFSTEPYVIRGWYRKGEDFFPRDKSEKRIRIGFWRIQTPDKIILLEKRKQKR